MVLTALRWLLFGVLLSLLPLGAVAVIDLSTASLGTLRSYLIRGDLYMISCVFCLASLAEIVDRSYERDKLKAIQLMVAFSCGIIAVLNATLFGSIYALQKTSSGTSEIVALADSSLTLFAASALVSTAGFVHSKVPG